MKKFALFIFLLSLSLCISSWVCSPKKKKEKQKFQVTGSIMETKSYCGGAQPSPEIMANLNKPSPIPFAKLFVKKGTENKEKAEVIEIITADSIGNFSISLPAGNYCVVEEWKTKKFELPENTEFQTVDSACYRNLYNNCDYQLLITDKNIDNIKIVFHRNCPWGQPCISYHGPLPPMAQPDPNRGKVGE